MASTHLVDINHNDELGKVIQKCNRNFRLVSGQMTKQDKINQRDNNEAIEEAVASAVSQVVVDLTSDIDTEATARRNADLTLQGEIDTLANSIDSKLLATHPVGSLFFSTDATSPSTFIGGQWQLVTNSFQIGSITTNVYQRTG